MAILRRTTVVGNFGQQYNLVTAARKLSESAKAFRPTASYDIFLSHSYSDARLIYATKSMLEKMGFATYVDWIEDPELKRDDVTSENAKRLKQRMDTCASLLFVATDNSSKSIWMPWELGYVDGQKGKVAILPIFQDELADGEFDGQEYLGLYPYVSSEDDLSLRKRVFVVNYLDTHPIDLKTWIDK